MYKILGICLLIFVNSSLFAQRKQAAHKNIKKGVIVFEAKSMVYDMYFIDAPCKKNFIELLEKYDTINAVMLGSPGDHVSNRSGYKAYLDQSIIFDTALLLIVDTLKNGLVFEDPVNIFYKYGILEYNSNQRDMMLRFKTLLWNNKSVVLRMRYFHQVKSFSELKSTRTSKVNSKNKKKNNR